MSDDRDFPERAEHLPMLAVSPAVWAFHLLACYITTAVWCAKAADLPMGTLRWAVGGYTLVALLLIGITGYFGWRRHLTGVDELAPHEEPTPGDRHRFIGFATLLLSGLSVVATLYVAMVVLFFENCR